MLNIHFVALQLDSDVLPPPPLLMRLFLCMHVFIYVLLTCLKHITSTSPVGYL